MRLAVQVPLRAWARELGLDDAVGLLEETLEEEKDTDATLTEMAESIINQKADGGVIHLLAAKRDGCCFAAAAVLL